MDEVRTDHDHRLLIVLIARPPVDRRHVLLLRVQPLVQGLAKIDNGLEGGAQTVDGEADDVATEGARVVAARVAWDEVEDLVVVLVRLLKVGEHVVDRVGQQLVDHARCGEAHGDEAIGHDIGQVEM